MNVGHADTTAEVTVAELRPSMVTVLPENNKLDIVIQVSNFHNSVGGIWYFSKLGTASQINADFIKNILVALFVAGCFFVAGIYYLIMFLHFRDRLCIPLLQYSVLCFLHPQFSIRRNACYLHFKFEMGIGKKGRIYFIISCGTNSSTLLLSFVSRGIFTEDFVYYFSALLNMCRT